MKRKVTFITLLLFCSLTFAAKWAVLETVDQGFYMYTITTAPAENKLSWRCSRVRSLHKRVGRQIPSAGIQNRYTVHLFYER